MECSISTHLIRDFSKILTCLSKFNDDFILRSSESDIQLSSLNSTKSGFIIFTLSSEFFDSYHLFNHDQDLTVKINTKALLSIMKLRNLEKNVQGFQLKIIDNELISRLIQTIKFNNGAIRTHKLLFTTATLTLPSSDPGSCANQLIANSRVLKDWLDHFTPFSSTTSSSSSDITLVCNDNTAKFANSSDSNYENISNIRNQATQTQVQVDTTEFDVYEINVDSAISFSLKEFKAILQLAEALGAPITLMFSTAPEPLHAVVDADDMRASMVLSTTQPSNYPSLNNNSVNSRSQTTPRRIQYESHYQSSSNINNNSASSAANFFNYTLPQSHRKKKPITMEHIPHFTSPQSHSIGNNNNNNDDQPLFLTQESYEPRPSQIVGFNSTDFDPSLATDGMNDFEMQNFVNNDMDLDPELDDDSNDNNNNNNDNDNDNDSVTEEETDDGIPIIQTAVSQKQLPSSHGVSINNDTDNNVYNNYEDEDDDTFEDSQRPIGGKKFKPLWYD